MLHIDTTDPSVLELHSRTYGCLSLFGLAIALLGGTLIALSLQLVPLTIPDPPDPSTRPVAALIGALILALGLLVMGGRRGVRLARHEQVAVRWFGLFVPLKSTARPLQDFQRVTLRREVRSGNKNRRVTYPVRLDGHGGAFDLDSDGAYATSRQLAETVARFLRLPMADSSSGEEIVRGPEHLDESFPDRMRRLGDEVELPPRPLQLRSTVEEDAGGMLIRIPTTFFERRIPVQLIAPLLVLGFVIFNFGQPLLGRLAGDQRLVALAVASLLLALGLPIVAMVRALISGFKPSLVRVDHRALRIERGGKVTEIPAHELEELSVVGRDAHQLLTLLPDGSARVNPKLLDSPEAAARMAREGQPPTLGPGITKLVTFLASLAPGQKCIMARSDKVTVFLGQGLPTGELAYLWALMAQAICR